MSFWSRLRRTFSDDGRNTEVDEEIQFHLAMKARDGFDARESRLRFGNPTAIREETRAMGIFEWLESVLQDARYGLRQLRRTPALTFSVIASLVIGIGANTAIFSIVDAALLRPLPVRDPKSLRIIEWASPEWPAALTNGNRGTIRDSPSGGRQGSSFGPLLYRALAREQSAFDSLIGFSDVGDAGVVVQGRAAEQTSLQYVSANFFHSLGIAPILGRAFVDEDDRIGQEPVVILSHRFWRGQLGGRPDVLDQTLRINSVSARIVGVAPPGFFGVRIGEWTDIYAPLASDVAFDVRLSPDGPWGEDDRLWWVRQMARLKPGVDAATALEQLSALYRRLVVPQGVEIAPEKIPVLVAEPGLRGFNAVRDETSRALWILLLLAGLILLIVCANVANLLLSRTVARQRDLAVRLALGAARLRLLRQQLVESLVLAAVGGALGLGLGYLLAASSQAVVQAISSLGEFDLHLDTSVLAYTGAISILTALLFGLAPALHAARADWSDALKSQGRSVLAGRLRLPRALVVFQFALCVTVLVAAGLLGRSLANLRAIDVGFDRENIVYASVNPWRAGYQAEQVGPYLDRLRMELASQPGILRVAAIFVRPLWGGARSAFVHFPDRDFRQDESSLLLVNYVSEGLFETLDIPLVAGRALEARDVRPNAEAVVVDELFVQRFFPNQNPLGQRFGMGSENDNHFEIVGVVRNSRYESLRQEARPTMYAPLFPAGLRGRPVHFVIRSAIDSGQLAQTVRRAAASVDPNIPIDDFETQTALIDGLLRTERLLSILSTAFGVVALVLAAVGLGGLLAYGVARRRNEIGIRMALGAAPGDVVRMVMGDSLWLVAIGVLVGLPGAYAIGRVLESALYGLEPADPFTTATSLAVLALVAALAAWLPARRAARIDPMSALRDE